MLGHILAAHGNESVLRVLVEWEGKGRGRSETGGNMMTRPWFLCLVAQSISRSDIHAFESDFIINIGLCHSLPRKKTYFVRE